ncbi:uncharacterized protein CPUR_03034 [Claviceps purpurea 20.1]|uniref:Uncharacterized protein n=1 Tax=Claviceps purpurea (strain 20.1) TaxID=1111077 RepID=M1W0F1_CLAP2|nr:uncharacterized protein CPUR_03034 [Claviceps purpurea 20.1]
MADLIEMGHDYVGVKRYKLALEHYRLVPGCSKNSKKVVAQGRSIFRQAMETCHCEALMVGLQRFNFVEALGRVGLGTTPGFWDWLAEPSADEGLSLLGPAPHLLTFVWGALHNCKGMATLPSRYIQRASRQSRRLENTMDSSPKLQQLYGGRESVNRHVLIQDPLCLPADLCLRVSKKWACTLTSPQNALLWRDMQFSDRRETLPGLEQLKKMLSWAGDGGARKVVIQSKMILTQSILTLLLDESPCLEYLKIGRLPREISFPTNGKTWNRLKHFSLERGWYYGSLSESPVDGPGGFPCSFLEDAASSLEHLEFRGIPTEWYEYEDPFIPFLPMLKTLRIYGSEREGFSFPIYPLSVAFPRLEQLDIGPDIPYLDPEPVSVWRDKRDDIWPHLKVLVFEKVVREPDSDTERTRSALRFLMCINRGNSLQHLVLELHWAWPEIDIFSGGDDLLPDYDIVQDSEFRNLRSFRSSRLSISPEGARNLLSKALQTNQLASFDIVFPLPFGDEPAEEMHVEHLRGYDWARGATSIQSLGLYELHIDGPPDNLNDEGDHFVARFLATFPNLRTLGIICAFGGADYASFLLQILRLTHLETMYMRLVDDEACAQVRQAARDKGVQLIEISDPAKIPRPWSKAWLETGAAWAAQRPYLGGVINHPKN